MIIGGGPAGLTAAYELRKSGRSAVVLEKDDCVGGISRTVEYKGYRYDIGGHRFFTKAVAVKQMWHEVLGDDLIVRPRLSRIYYNERFFDYPLKAMNALRGLGVVEAVRIVMSYLKARAMPSPEEKNLEQWVTNRFGRRLFEIFFKTYTEKVWGIPCHEIGADWAAQRIKSLDLLSAIKNALIGNRGKLITSLIEQFHYPRLGPGMMWERVMGILEASGSPVKLGTHVVRIRHVDRRVAEVVATNGDGLTFSETGEHFVSSMPIRELVEALDPPPPERVLVAARKLKYRDFLTVGLVIRRQELFPDNWIYIHSPKVRVGRIQNFKSWSPEMVPDPKMSSIGLEYFVQEGDDLWTMDDADLIALAKKETAILGLVREDDVVDGTVIRMPKAYPVYDSEYRGALEQIKTYLAEAFTNLQLVGRNGQHRYNNQDHSMLTAMYAAQNIGGATHDVWGVNLDDDYHEEVEKKAVSGATGERLVPRRLDPVEALLEEAFARYDPVALGVAVAVVGSLSLILATLVTIWVEGEAGGPTLTLLANYLAGYRVSYLGALVGGLEAAIGGYVFGNVLARVINGLVAIHERSLLRELELDAALDAVSSSQPEGTE